jgi:uncharacterized protein
VEKMTAKYGPVYYPATMPKGSYPGMEDDLPVAAVANTLIAHEAMDDKLVLEILSAIFDHRPELVAVHKQAESIDLKGAVEGSPIPYHKAAQKFFKDKGLNVPA